MIGIVLDPKRLSWERVEPTFRSEATSHYFSRFRNCVVKGVGDGDGAVFASV